jgi:site-specific DNA recombinase
MNKGVVVYTRVSTDEQAERGNSLHHQKDVLIKFEEIKKNEVLKLFVEDFSAKTFDRPEWSKLMAYVTANRKIVHEIHVLRWDRFSRNLENALKVIRDLKKLDITVNAIEQPLDMESPDHKVLLALYLVMPEVENDKNSMRTTESSRKARLNGCWTGTPPRGYSPYRNVNNKSTLIRNEKADLVIESFMEVAKNQCPVDTVRKEMNKKGLKMVKQAFLDMLRNVAYTGKILVRQWKKEDAVVVNGLHEGIINDDLFSAVQDVLAGKKKIKSKSSKENEALPLRGYLKCPVCHGSLTGGAYRGRSKYYNY